MKECKQCHSTKNEFRKGRGICRECERENNRATYKKNGTKWKATRKKYFENNRQALKEKHREWERTHPEEVKAMRKRSYERKKALIDSYKTECHFCGEDFTLCLSFHHKDPSTKEFTIGTNKMKSNDALIREIQKCIVVCENCHRKLHAGVLHYG